MKIAIIGAGAIGGYVAAKLAQGGHEVGVIMRGANLAAVRANGLGLIEIDGNETFVPVRASDKLADLGRQDIIILAMKAHQVGAVAPDLHSLLSENSMIVTMQNGVPWWYFYKNGGPYEGARLETVDPGGLVSRHIPIDQVIGSIVYPACVLQAPGIVRHVEGNKFTLGEIDGADTERIRVLAGVFREAGLKAPIVSDIRSEMWIKLWGNVCFNPISALTHATLQEICEYPAVHDTVKNVMSEAQAIGEALGVKFKIPLERRIAGAAAIGHHKTSMLQDVEAGRPIELDAIVGAMLEMSKIAKQPAPAIAMLHGLTSLLANSLQNHHGRLQFSQA